MRWTLEHPLLRVCSVGIILCIALAALSNPDALAPRTKSSRQLGVSQSQP